MKHGRVGPVCLFMIFCLLLSACPCLGDDGGLPADENIYYDGTYYYYDEQGGENGAPFLPRPGKTFYPRVISNRRAQTSPGIFTFSTPSATVKSQSTLFG